MTDILMPALSPTMEEGTLAKWHVKEGDTVQAGDVIAEIETDKATMEVEAVDEGEVTEILVAEGTEGVKVNTPIARLKDEGGAATPAPKAPEGGKSNDERIFASPLARRIAAQNGVDLKSIKGTGPHGRIVRRDVEGVKGGAASRPSISQSMVSGKCGTSRKLSVRRRAIALRMPSSGIRS